jgi:hypothetical protein
MGMQKPNKQIGQKEPSNLKNKFGRPKEHKRTWGLTMIEKAFIME